MVQDASAVAALDQAVKAYGLAKAAQAALSDSLEQANHQVMLAQIEAMEAEDNWRQLLEAFVHEHGHLIHDADTRGWMVYHLRNTLGWSDEMVSELEETTRWR